MRESFSLYELQRIVGAAVEQFFPQPVWVSAEISELKVNATGHCYMELVERDEKGSSGNNAKAQARAMIWKNRFPQLNGKFEAATGRALAAAMKVLLQVTVTHHPLYGLSLQVTDIDPFYTIGEAERQRQITIAKLQSDGVWDMNRGVAIPRIVQRVAVVSSATAAGYRDFINEINSSPYRIVTTLFEASMQGQSSEQSIIAALLSIAERQEEFDAVAIIRGGGSVSDLECFNAYATASYVAQFPLPVLSGIGHDKDTSVVDMVAAVPLKTPTAVAAWICDRAATFDAQLEYAAVLLRESCTKVTQAAALRLEQYQSTLKSSVMTALERQRERLNSYAMLTENFAPARLLRLGFAVARGEGGVIRKVDDVAVGERITIEVADGTLKAEIVEKNG
ncbi:MAG: exodeoxyribonuclease VII large subunit [Alistipes sp.]|nr:exodeoxyribonuclease VII large subunit [Alistipes sp.]